MQGVSSNGPLVSVSTFLTPLERARVDAAGEGSYRAIHRDGVADVVSDIKSRRADVVLVSVARCDGLAQAGVTAMVREFPRISTVALVSGSAADMPRVALTLGSSGITQLVDVREPAGWYELRRLLLASRSEDIQREALTQLALDLAGAEAECWRFFEAVFTAGANVSTIRQLARALGVYPSTLMSRFYRAGLPAPKQYLAMARLMRAARLFENSGFSIANVANHLEYSSPQSFGRHVRTIMQMTAGQVRARFDGAGMLDHFRRVLVLPYRDRLCQLRPIGGLASISSRASSFYVH
jgi:AraC-like DNA-binding protein